LKQNHFKENLLNHLPKHLKNSGLTTNGKDESPNDDNLALEPDLNKVVIIKVIRRYDKFAWDLGHGKEIDFIPGDIFCIKFKNIKTLYENGYVELI